MLKSKEIMRSVHIVKKYLKTGLSIVCGLLNNGIRKRTHVSVFDFGTSRITGYRTCSYNYQFTEQPKVSRIIIDVKEILVLTALPLPLQHDCKGTTSFHHLNTKVKLNKHTMLAVKSL